MVVGFIGAGNMGSAMIEGVTKNFNECQIVVCDNDKIKTDVLRKHHNLEIIHSVEELCNKAKYIVLAIKPQNYVEVFMQMKEYLTSENIIITIAPGFAISKTKKYLGDNVRVVYAMPNTPAMVGEGVTAYCYNDGEITKDEDVEINSLFASFGVSVKINESNMEAVIATSGSSPAYAYIFIEAMADAAVALGLKRDVAYELAAQTLKGAAQMVLETKKHPGELKDAVCSPGGTTIQAVMKLEETQFRNSIMKAMIACYDKAKSMG